MTKKIFTQELSFGEIFFEAIRIMKNRSFLLLFVLIIISNIILTYLDMYQDYFLTSIALSFGFLFLLLFVSILNLTSILGILNLVE